MNLCVIPARGGSKRIPRKNIRVFAGKPMIAYAIEAAQKSGLFSRIVVSTDDEEVAKISREIGAEVPFMRPAELSDDVFSATTFGYPIFRAIEQQADGKLRMFFPEYFLSRSQDLPEAIHDAGQFYWGLPGAWLENKQIFDRWSSVVMLPRWRVQDVDTPEDWERAEILARLLNEARDIEKDGDQQNP